ncbi:Alpha-ribazole phosphatase [Tritonibacter multivorans]|uniref:Alpha-ribazole phosphatase n=1 Tax=Tritonibacter multivorans TaxID=928856 RepID=A0A0P1G7K7_9RHOB|nr:histidine phosphatase family protein [Tritonibacter multivorans]MDA7421156.1 histidine phosphatase family protein [Tritonibacter multivorans]CUH77611.1 Alpha-ribazole phosphatase [Tritonibacter multivorans]SFD34517.1 Broad specificity phosphatase PhoE [Tritonibacter multivorans]
MITRFHLIRHGPTHAKSMVGWSDLPADLSDIAAIARLEAALPREAVVISSDLIRAVATADAIQGDRPRLPHTQALREMHFGDWELRRWKDIDAEDPDRIRAFWEEPGDNAAPGGESWNMLSARVNAQMDHLAQAHAGRDVIVVGHFGQILCQIERAGGMTTTEAFGQKIDNLSLSRIHHGPEGWGLTEINHNP